MTSSPKLGFWGCLLLFLLVSGRSEEIKDEIVVGVIVDREDTTTRLAIQKAVASFLPETPVKIKEVFVDENSTTEVICQSIIGSGPAPTFVIDTTEKTSHEGDLSKQFLRQFGIPTVTTSSGMKEKDRSFPELGKRESEWLLQINNPTDIVSSLGDDIITEYGITNAVLFYDSSFEVVKRKFEKLTHHESFRFRATYMDKDNIQELLAATKSENITNYIVFSGMPTINRFLEQAGNFGMLDTDISYYFVTKSRGQIKCPSCRTASVLLIQPLTSSTQEYNHSANLVNVNAENKLQVYFYYDLTRFLIQAVSQSKETSKWPAITYPTCPNGQLTDKDMKERDNLIFGTELATDGFYGKFGRFVFDDFMKAVSFQDIDMRVTKLDFLRGTAYNTKLGEWSFGPSHGRFVYGSYQTSSESSTSVSETAPGKKLLRIVIYLQPPFIMKRLVHKEGRTVVEYFGYCIDLINMIRDKMANASAAGNKKAWKWDYELYEVPDGRAGEKRPDGSWTGVIGQLNTRVADVGLGPIAVMAERETAVDFTVPYYDLVGINILMKKAAVPSHLFKFLTVLDSKVWLSILTSYLIVSTFIWIYHNLSPFSYKNNKDGWADQKRREFTFKETLWFCMTSLTPQGGGEGPQNTSGRIAALAWWSFGFVVIAAYTANLAAFLTVSRLDSTIESLDHLAQQFRIRYATQDQTEALVYFQRMSYIEHKFYQIWKNMSLNENVDLESRAQFTVWDYPISNKYTKMLAQMYQAKMPKSYDEGVRRVKESPSAQEGFAFIADAVSIKFAIKGNCDLHSIGNEFSRKPIALVVQQNSTLKDALSSAILKLLNERKLETLKEVWWRKYSRKCEDTKKSSDGISIHNIGGVFIVIFAGVILACITLVFEYITLRSKRNRMKNSLNQANRSYAGMFKNSPGSIARTSFGQQRSCEMTED